MDSFPQLGELYAKSDFLVLSNWSKQSIEEVRWSARGREYPSRNRIVSLTIYLRGLQVKSLA